MIVSAAIRMREGSGGGAKTSSGCRAGLLWKREWDKNEQQENPGTAWELVKAK
jgi:hypothetical protein